MSSRKEITIEVRRLVVKFRNEKKSFGEIGKLLNLKKSTVQTIFNNFKNTNNFESKVRSGRPKKLSARDERFILKEVANKPMISGPKLAEELAKRSNIIVHPRTIQKTLNNNGYNSRTPRKKPFISAKNQALRLEFAQQHLDKDIDFWKKVLFTDESKYNIFGNDGRAKVWRKINTALHAKNVIPTVKYGGGSVMVWGAVAASGVGNLVFVEGNMDRFQYKNILEQNLKTSVENLSLGDRWIFQQDQDPKHTALLVKDWLLYHAPRQLYTPPPKPRFKYY